MLEYAQSFPENRSDVCVLSDLTDQHLKDKRVTVGRFVGRAIEQINLFDLPVDYDGVGRSVELMRTPMSWRDELNPSCDRHQVLYRDDGEVLGCVLRLEGDPSIYTHTLTCDALRRLGAHPTVAAARRAVERAIRHRGGRAVAVRAGN